MNIIPPESKESRNNKIPGLYKVLHQPAPLAGMPYPYSLPRVWEDLYNDGFKSVVCLMYANPPYEPSPLRILYAVRLQDLCMGGEPHQIKVEEDELKAIVKAVQSELIQGRGVVLHCIGGTGRTGTSIGAILRALGFSITDVLDYMHRLKSGWPESEWQRKQVKRDWEKIITD